jgi:hypothetical protein
MGQLVQPTHRLSVELVYGQANQAQVHDQRLQVPVLDAPLFLLRLSGTQVDPCETTHLKPGDHFIGSRVETRRFQATEVVMMCTKMENQKYFTQGQTSKTGFKLQVQ